MKRPILIIAYKRYVNVINILNSVNSEDVSSVYLALDGLGEKDFGERQEFLDEIETISFENKIKLNIWKRDINLGPAVSVITAIDWFFSMEDSGIILEDDLVIEAKTIDYFDKSLTFYKKERNVYLVSGSQYWNLSERQILNPWSTYPITWGWATWRDRWKEMRSVYFMDSIESPKSDSLPERFFWKVGFYRCIFGIQDAWDIPIANYIHNQRGICILPNVNLVTNIGADEYAGNTHSAKWPLMTPIVKFEPILFFNSSSRLKNSDCLDDLIRSEIYGISTRNVFSGIFFFLLNKHISLKQRNLIKLSNRIQVVRIPSE